MKNFLALLLFLGGFAAWYFHHEKTETLGGIESAQAQLADLEKNTATKRAEYQAAVGMMNIKAKVDAKKVELAELQKKLQALQQQQITTDRDKQNTLIAIRQKFIGQTLPIVLAGGRDLGNARIIKIDDTGLSVATTSGVVKIAPSELTNEQKALFHYTL